MKKLLLASFLVLMGTTINAQSGNFKIGTHLGLPTGDLSDYSLDVGLDVTYMLNISEDFNVGFTTGYSHYLGGKSDYSVPNYNFGEYGNTTITYTKETIEGGGTGLVLLAVTAEYLLIPEIYLGADLGYAFFIAPNGGTFYYQPKVEYKFNAHELYLGYKGTSRGGSVNLGYAFTFGK